MGELNQNEQLVELLKVLRANGVSEYTGGPVTIKFFEHSRLEDIIIKAEADPKPETSEEDLQYYSS